ncbi:DUF3343 domain-containing protein [Desulfosporosinus meridiei]|uniref:Putative Se/S carrier protein-like domain-containing protein n=1 Tax=Desulfosporosinus meridiei (strain ATCC BAA-275 / DSM 13257 / KCTC 12902 / NCIMB 13706 / S10) TaxID=768704 RepID=J7J2A9_DESMD|nr:DUF3343 domain-containing protein [Desulfosporosinus meridiei]AFQ45116.1 Protein of unknown function (DUF3343) [Desulfosporosinus meridiei DSM 13257]
MEASKEYFAVFFTPSGAIRFHRFLRSNNIPAEVKPLPRILSISCGIGIEFFTNLDVNLLISKDIKELYLHQGYQYTLKYTKDQ